MKYSQELASQIKKLPQGWQNQMIPYKSLKKSIRTIVAAMEEAGITELPRDCTAIYSLVGQGQELESNLVLYVNDPTMAQALEAKHTQEYEGTPSNAMKALHLDVDSPMLTAQDKSTWNEKAFLERLEKEREMRSQLSPSRSGQKPRRVSVQLRLGEKPQLLPLPEALTPVIPPRTSSLTSLSSPSAEVLESMPESTPARPSDLMFSMDETTEATYDEYHSSGDETDDERVPPVIIEPTEEPYSTSAPADISADFIRLSEDWESDDSRESPTIPHPMASPVTSRSRAKSTSALTSPRPFVPLSPGPPSPTSSPIFDSPTLSTVAVVSSGVLCTPKNPSKEGKTFALPLQADAEFLNKVASCLMQLSQFQASLEKGLQSRIEAIKITLADVAGPGKKDMYAWREVLAAYLDAEIWESFSKKPKTIEQSEANLAIFAKESMEMRRNFKLLKSQRVLDEFLALSETLNQVRLFSDINERAIYKILKKHDKRTNLAHVSLF